MEVLLLGHETYVQWRSYSFYEENSNDKINNLWKLGMATTCPPAFAPSYIVLVYIFLCSKPKLSYVKKLSVM